MRIRLFGKRNTLGIGQHYANFCDTIKRRSGAAHLVEEIDFTNNDLVAQARDNSQPTDINISFVGVNIHDIFQGTNIQWTVFESTLINPKSLAVLQASDQVWVPSDWGQDILIKNGINSEVIHVVPEGVDPDKFWAPSHPKPKSDPLTYLFVGKYEDRKSCQELLTAWAEAWGNHRGARLIVKTNYFTDVPERFEQMKSQVQSLGLSNVQVLWGEYTDQQMFDLYRASDVFVFPTKAEGWGLPLIEAAAMGLPIVTTFYSAPTAYLQHIQSSCLFVDYDIEPIQCPDYRRHYPNMINLGEWAVPRTDYLAQCLQLAQADYDNLSAHAHRNSNIIRQQWTWNRSVDRVIEVLTQTQCL